MSATNRGKPRRARDYYRTPDWAIDAIIPHLPVNADVNILEPGCGDGAIISRLVAHGANPANILGVEIDAIVSDYTRTTHGVVVANDDFLSPDYDPGYEVDLTVMNPPYKKALEFVEKAIRLTSGEGTVAALLRLGFMSSKKRRQFHLDHPSDVYVLPRRPSFTGGGTDACDYAWMVWNSAATGTWRPL